MMHVAGVDVHKTFFEVTYRDYNGEIKVTRVDNNAHGLGKLIKFLKTVGVTDVYLESTGDYYYALYYALKGAGVRPHVLNAYKVRRPEANKTDERDAVWLLKIGESKLFDDSYIPDERVQILRFLIRKKTKITDRMADLKREIGSILSRLGLNIKQLSGKLKARGRLKTLLSLIGGKVKIDDVEDGVVRAIYQALASEAGGYYMLVVGVYLKELELLEGEVKGLDKAILNLIDSIKGEIEILISVPGIGLDLAIKILAEIGEVNRFPSARHLVSYAGLAPTARNSGGKNRSGKPTKKSDKHLRRYMYLAAMAAVRSKNSVVRKWFERLIDRGKHFKVAIIAVARKLLTIIWHLLMKGEKWSEKDFVKKPRKLPKIKKIKISLEKALEILEKAGYIIKPPNS
ncbi:MAG: IS110 family transposase [Candidatus Njordarchaeia archaeon]